MSQDLWNYAEAGTFWERFQPQTPFGRAAKEEMRVETDKDRLEENFDRTEAALGLLADLESERVRLDQILHHLKRLPRFPQTVREAFDEVEIFQFKKFLVNHGKLLRLLPHGLKEQFGLAPLPTKLGELLSLGRQADESFYIADAYDPELSEVRLALRENGSRTKTLARAAEDAVRERWGFSFEERPFLLVPRGRITDVAAAADLLDIEPWDSHHLCVRKRSNAEALKLAEEKARLLTRERLVESEVLKVLSGPLRDALPLFTAQMQAVEGFDIALSRALMVKPLGLTRPVLGEGDITIVRGRHLPTEALCESLDVPYTPLDAVFGSGPAVIFGSNMGGKTVVLKTLGFLQLLSQSGFFVPAEHFETRVFTRFHYVGEGPSRGAARGLSGFGFEIRQFNETFASFEHETLALFDEFARTTSSGEAAALLSAILEDVAGRPRVIALFSTHFQGIRRLAGVRYLRMGGLDRSRLDLSGAEEQDLSSRIREIDRLMRFSLEPDTPSLKTSDAITVARLLGLSPLLASRAEAFHKNED